MKTFVPENPGLRKKKTMTVIISRMFGAADVLQQCLLRGPPVSEGDLMKTLQKINDHFLDGAPDKKTDTVASAGERHRRDIWLKQTEGKHPITLLHGTLSRRPGDRSLPSAHPTGLVSMCHCDVVGRFVTAAARGSVEEVNAAPF